jgi:hypothetical protein
MADRKPIASTEELLARIAAKRGQTIEEVGARWTQVDRTVIDRALVGRPKKQRFTAEEREAFLVEGERQAEEEAFEWKVKQLKTYHSEIPELVNQAIVKLQPTNEYQALIEALDKQPVDERLAALTTFRLPPLPDLTDRAAVQMHFEGAARVHLRLRNLIRGDV